MIVVIDYNVGNVKSVRNAFEYIGLESKLSNDPGEIAAASGLVLPGVAAFGFAVNELGSLADKIIEAARSGKPLLGICVGYQMLFESSSEMGEHKGLGLIKGTVQKVPAGRVIPHMGWNKVIVGEPMSLLGGLGAEKHFYFAHSYCARITDDAASVAYTEYDGVELTAAVQKQNIFGVQFHPEKSSNQGLKVLSNFVEICERARDAD